MLSAYDMASPTMPAPSGLPLTTEMMAKPAAAKITTDPMNSSRMASQRFALMDGK